MIVNSEWLLWPALFSPILCDLMIERAMRVADMAGDMTNRNDLSFPEVRSSRLRWLFRNHPDFAPFFDLADRAFAEGQCHFTIKIDPFDAFQFTEYHAMRRGLYDWHRDDFPEEKRSYDRRLSLCIQLSEPDSYIGASLELQAQNPPPADLLRQRGAALLFRSSMKHRVTATLKGTRYSAIAWALGHEPAAS